MEYQVRCGRTLSDLREAHQLAEKVYREYGLVNKVLPFVHCPYMMVYNEQKRLVGTMTVQVPKRKLNCEKIFEIDLADVLPKGYTRERIIEVGRLGLATDQSAENKWLSWYGVQYGNCVFQEQGGYDGWVCIIGKKVERMLQKLGFELTVIDVDLEDRIHDQLEELSSVYFDRNNFPRLNLIDCKQMRAAYDKNPLLRQKLHVIMDSMPVQVPSSQKQQGG